MKGLQRAVRTRAAGHWAPCHSLGWQEVASCGCGSAGRTDWQEISAASKSAKRRASEAPVPTGDSQLQRPKTEESDSWARSSPGMSSLPLRGAIRKQAQMCLQQRVTPG